MYGPAKVEMGGLWITEDEMFMWEVWGRDAENKPILMAYFRWEEDAEAFAKATTEAAEELVEIHAEPFKSWMRR